MFIGRSTEHAIIGLMWLTRHSETPMKIEEIAEKEKISETYLEKVFQKLSQKKIVKPKFGPGGGFVLGKDPKEITLLEVMRVFQEKQMGHCVNFKPRNCGKRFCPFRKVIGEAKKNLFDFLDKKTISDLVNEETDQSN